MLAEGSFLATALAIVGFAPARDALRQEPPLLPIPMAPKPVVDVDRPTMTESPPSQGASVSAIPAKTMAAMPAINAKRHSIDVTALARIPDINAVEFFIDEWIDLGVEHAASLDELLRDYKAMREIHPFLPPVSKKRLSQLLAMHGSRRFVSDTKDIEGQRHRVVYFEMRAPRQAQRRAAA
jgi:hypothetical protein